MSEAEPLLTFAEIAVTLTGFSGLIAAFQSRSLDEWNPRDLLIPWLILGLGGLAMLSALLPVRSQNSSAGPDSVPRVMGRIDHAASRHS